MKSTIENIVTTRITFNQLRLIRKAALKSNAPSNIIGAIIKNATT